MINGSDHESEESLHEPLTRREQEILGLLAEGLTASEIADRLTLAVSSVRWYIQQIYGKLGVNGKRQAVARAVELGILRPGAPLLADIQGSISPVIGAVTFLHPGALINARPLIAASQMHNLPLQLTPFIGREAEIKALCELLNDRRLVTVIGSGGVGKTRLSLHVAETTLERFKDGTWLVELAPLADPALVPQTVVQTLGLREVPGQSTTQVLCEHLQSKRLLLVLDNCEHVVDAAADLVDALLHACPNLHILATSREILGVAGEAPFRCPSLAFPDPDHLPSLPELAEYESVKLFVEQAHTASPEFILTDQNAATIARLCQRLDGIPLAIELGAARVRVLSVEQILSRLDHAFHLLTGGSRTVLPRHQTLKALIDWSYNLLSDQERQLLIRLSLFAGGWTLVAAESVCPDPEEGSLPVEAILELLSHLVDKSLVVTQQDNYGSITRYRMIETIRQYAQARLLENGGGKVERERHLDYFLSLCLEAEEHLRGQDRRQWMERLGAELGNLRLAMEWSLSGSITKGLQLASALSWFWHGSRYQIEGVNWLERLLAAEVDSRSSQSSQPGEMIERMAARGKALTAAGFIGRYNGRSEPGMYAEAATIFQSLGDRYPRDLAYVLFLTKKKDLLENLEVARKIGDRWLISEILAEMGQVAHWNRDMAQFSRYINEQLTLRRKIGDVDGQGFPLSELGFLEFYQGNFSQALEFFKASLATFHEAGNPEYSAYSLRFQAWVALAQGDYTQALRFSQAQLSAGRDIGIPWVTADALGFLGWEAWLLHEEDQAIRNCEEALNLAGRTSNVYLSVAHYVLGRLAFTQIEPDKAFVHLKDFLTNIKDPFPPFPPVQLGIHAFGILAATQAASHPKQALRAAVLFGGQGVMEPCLMNIISPLEREAYNQALAATRQALGEEVFGAAWAEGQAMTTDQAIQYAVNWTK